MPFEADSLRKTLPQTPIKNHVANFRDNPTLDFSSGLENASSPENNADTEATPDVPGAGVKNLNENVTVFRGHANNSPSKSPAAAASADSQKPANPRHSLSSYFTLPARFSPSHKSLIKRDKISRAAASSGLLHRPTKRKRKDLHHADAQFSNAPGSDQVSDYDSDYDAAAPSSPRKPSRQLPPSGQQPPQEVGLIPSILTFISTHPHLPHILSWYLQLLLSLFILIFLGYVLYSFYTAILHDVDLKAEELSRDILSAMAACAEDFATHGCAERSRLGGSFKRMCDEWEVCMNQDYKAVGRARISAQTWAGILNGFVDEVSGRIWVGLGIGVVGVVCLPGVLFGWIRGREQGQQQQQQQMGGQDGVGVGMGMQRQGSFAGMQPPLPPQSPWAGEQQPQFFTPGHARSYDAFGGGGPGEVTAGRRSPSKEMMMGRSWMEGGSGAGDGSPTKRIGYR